MKKILYVFLSICLIIAMVACGTVDDNKTEINQTDDNKSTGYVDEDFDATRYKDLNTVLYQYTGPTMLKEERTSEFDVATFKNSAAKKELKINLRGTEYTLVYDVSAVIACSDLTVDTYKNSDLEEGRVKVYIDSESGDIKKYEGIPYTEELNTEEEYIKFIKTLVPSNIDLSEYKYACTTHYYHYGKTYYGDKMMRSTTDDGFILPSENTEIRAYTFYYTKMVGDILTDDHITVEFSVYENTFRFENVSCDMDYIRNTLLQWDVSNEDFERYINHYFASNFTDKYIFLGASMVSRKAFVKDEKLYIYTKSKVNSLWTVDQSQTWTSYIQTISCISDYIKK